MHEALLHGRTPPPDTARSSLTRQIDGFPCGRRCRGVLLERSVRLWAPLTREVAELGPARRIALAAVQGQPRRQLLSKCPVDAGVVPPVVLATP